MPWRETSAMDERLRFVQDVHRPGWSIAELCRRYEVSRKTGYKWLRAYARGGPAALADGSHRPHTSPQATAPSVVRLILELQRRYTWGARKVRRLLQARVPANQVPTKTTIHRILERHGRVRPRRRSPCRTHPGAPGTPMEQPNAVWTADFKGQFRTTNGVYCYPLTVQDGATRFLLGCGSLLEPTIEASWPVFARLFRRYGLPERIRTDNGAPFASNALGRLSTLSVWWVQLGIRAELIEPRASGAERAARAHAQDAQGRDRAAATAHARRSAAAVRLVPAALQHRAATRSARPAPARAPVPRVAASLPHHALADHVSGAICSAAGESQRWHSLGQSLGEREPRARGTRRRFRGNR